MGFLSVKIKNANKEDRKLTDFAKESFNEKVKRFNVEIDVGQEVFSFKARAL